MTEGRTPFARKERAITDFSQFYRNAFVSVPGEYVVLINPERKFIEVNASFGNFVIPYIDRINENLFYLGNYDDRDWFIFVDEELGAVLNVVDKLLTKVNSFALSNDYTARILEELERGIEGLKTLNDSVLAHYWQRPPTVWFEDLSD
jgi:hypothetical protein